MIKIKKKKIVKLKIILVLVKGNKYTKKRIIHNNSNLNKVLVTDLMFINLKKNKSNYIFR